MDAGPLSELFSSIKVLYDIPGRPGYKSKSKNGKEIYLIISSSRTKCKIKLV